jgi:hypothetical protein
MRMPLPPAAAVGDVFSRVSALAELVTRKPVAKEVHPRDNRETLMLADEKGAAIKFRHAQPPELTERGRSATPLGVLPIAPRGWKDVKLACLAPPVALR